LFTQLTGAQLKSQKSESVVGIHLVRDDNLWHLLPGLHFTFLQSFVFGNTLDWTWLVITAVGLAHW